jgi:glycosyltransferase involved in cell wall biosynthesis
VAMHIGILTRSVLAHQQGGMEIHTDIIRRQLVKHGHRVSVITTAHPLGQAQITDDAGTTYFVGQGPPGAYAASWWDAAQDTVLKLHHADPFALLAGQGKAIYHYLAQRQHLPASAQIPSLIFTHNNIITDFQNYAARGVAQPLRFARWMPDGVHFYRDDRRYMPQADGIVVLNAATADIIHRWFRVPFSRITTIPNGIDLTNNAPDTAARAAIRQQLAITDDQSCIVVVGRLVSDKGHRYLIAALRHPVVRPLLARLRLVFVGDGPLRHALQRMVTVADLARHVHFAGQVPADHVAAFLNGADIVASASLFEGVPLSLLEAMACAKPVVATDVGQVRSIVQHGTTGWVVPAGRVAPLARALAQLIEDPTQAQRFGQAGRHVVLRQHNVLDMAEHYVAVCTRYAQPGV